MKLKNKKTGEIKDWSFAMLQNVMQITERKHYGSLAELNEEWEDYEEPEMFYIVEQRGMVGSRFRTGDEYEKMFKEIGNYFGTKEEAEKAVEKLKAWKRLRDKGFKFTGFAHKDRGRLDELEIYCQLGECPENIEEMDDVHLLFGVEE